MAESNKQNPPVPPPPPSYRPKVPPPVVPPVVPPPPVAAPRQAASVNPGPPVGRPTAAPQPSRPQASPNVRVEPNSPLQTKRPAPVRNQGPSTSLTSSVAVPVSNPSATPSLASTAGSISSTSALADRRDLASSRRRSRAKTGLFASAGARLAARWQQARRMPAWLMSFVFHLLLLIILALIPIPGMGGSAITLFFGGNSSGISDFELAGGDPNQENNDEPLQALEVSQTQVDYATMLAATTPTTLEVSKITPTDMTSMLRVDQPSASFGEEIAKEIAKGLRGRQGANKGDLLRRGGGTAETEEAVEMGLKWLVKQQRSDGSWSLTGPYSDGGVHENTIAATGMALNAFLGAGYHQLEGKYAGNIERGLNYLLKLQKEDGFFTTGKEQRDQRHYAQAIATISIMEAYGLTNEYKLREPCKKAISYAEWAQSRLKGWRYQPREDADVSVTGWFVMALETAKLVGFPVDEEKLQSVHTYLDSVGHRDMSAYAYNDLNQPDLTMTAEGLLCRIWLGWSRTHPSLIKGVQELSVSIPHERDPKQSVYYWYYATQVLHHYGGEPWETWNNEMKRALPEMQEKNGDEKGSWAPKRDVYGVAGGRLYTTALSIYCLEVYYRHLAIYDVEE